MAFPMLGENSVLALEVTEVDDSQDCYIFVSDGSAVGFLAFKSNRTVMGPERGSVDTDYWLPIVPGMIYSLEGVKSLFPSRNCTICFTKFDFAAEVYRMGEGRRR